MITLSATDRAIATAVQQGHLDVSRDTNRFGDTVFHISDEDGLIEVHLDAVATHTRLTKVLGEQWADALMSVVWEKSIQNHLAPVSKSQQKRLAIQRGSR